MQALDIGLVHGTAVAVDGQGLLILGKSGSGKSGLALSMIALGARLISDDQVELRDHPNAIRLHPAPNIAGKIEARNLGILATPAVADIPLKYVVNLDQSTSSRLPDVQHILVGSHKINLIAGQNVPNLGPALFVLMSGAGCAA